MISLTVRPQFIGKFTAVKIYIELRRLIIFNELNYLIILCLHTVFCDACHKYISEYQYYRNSDINKRSFNIPVQKVKPLSFYITLFINRRRKNAHIR